MKFYCAMTPADKLPTPEQVEKAASLWRRLDLRTGRDLQIERLTEEALEAQEAAAHCYLECGRLSRELADLRQQLEATEQRLADMYNNNGR